MIPYGRQQITEDDIAAVVEVLRSDWITQGPAIERFEAAVAAACGARHVVALATGTAGLHVACLGVGLGPGGLLWTVPNSFVASANCGLACGADVDFVDIDARTLNLDPGALAAKLERADRAGRLPDVVVPVHFAGHPTDGPAVAALAERYGFRVIEDASHAIGSRRSEGPVGDGRFAAAAVFSFHPVKIVTTGEGGAIATNDDAMAARMREYRTHGITRDPARMTGEPDGPWCYEQIALSGNFRITDFQCALGVSQLARLDDYVERRNALARRYDERLADLPVVPQAAPAAGRSAFHLYVVRLDRRRCARSRREVFDALRADGIGVNVHYIPIHLHGFWRARGFARGDFPEAERYYDEALTLPLFPTMTERQQDRVVAALRRATGS